MQSRLAYGCRLMHGKSDLPPMSNYLPTLMSSNRSGYTFEFRAEETRSFPIFDWLHLIIVVSHDELRVKPKSTF